MTWRTALAVAFAAWCGAGSPAAAQDRGAGKAVYEKTCALCHAAGVAGAPRLGDGSAWAPRVRAGKDALYKSALGGTAKGMPAKGGDPGLSDTEVRAAVDFMLSAAGGALKPAAAKPPAKNPAAAVAGSVAKTPPAKNAAAAAAGSVAPPLTPVPARAEAVAAAGDPNAFNRLLTPPSASNRPPAEDGIHDSANPGTQALQAPLQSFQGLPRSNAGNRVDWVAALARKQIQPRWDAANPSAVPTMMDLNIVREVKGSMPDVVYPHKQHTEWLDCSNCHPAIFVPQKGANQISMAAIMLGQKCGVCHGKVAFPVSECRLCHSRNKTHPTGATATGATETRK